MTLNQIPPAPRIVAFAIDGQRRIGVVSGTSVYDAPADYGDIGALVAAGPDALKQALREPSRPLHGIRLLAPVDRMARIFCIALNYRAHADESGGADPGLPVIFHKLDSSLVGPYDPIQTPTYTQFLDYEAELAVVIGHEARHVSVDEALGSVGGYTVLNDVSCRDSQPTKLGDQTIIDWFSAKAADATTPVGPWIVPAEEIVDPQGLRVTLALNGETLQDASTALMIFSVARIIEFLSERVTLRPGDLIATGTPSGVGKARGIRLLPGDVIETRVEGVGALTNQVVAAIPRAPITAGIGTVVA